MTNIPYFEGQNEIEFIKKFSDESTCLSLLADYKWSAGFLCPHCQGKEEHNCKIAYHKRCKQCSRIISPTANTLFHKVKFGITKAFYIVFKMSATTKSISAEQLSKSIGVNRKTALLFQQKVRLAMKSSERYPLTGQVEVDEAFIGQKEDGRVGRGAQGKAQIVIAIQKYGATGLKRMYAKVIENASAGELLEIFEKHVDRDAKILTDQWRGYSPLTEAYNIKQEKSQPDANFRVMHRCIQQLKSWIRGIHHSVDHNTCKGIWMNFATE